MSAVMLAPLIGGALGYDDSSVLFTVVYTDHVHV